MVPHHQRSSPVPVICVPGSKILDAALYCLTQRRSPPPPAAPNAHQRVLLRLGSLHSFLHPRPPFLFIVFSKRWRSGIHVARNGSDGKNRRKNIRDGFFGYELDSIHMRYSPTVGLWLCEKPLWQRRYSKQKNGWLRDELTMCKLLV